MEALTQHEQHICQQSYRKEELSNLPCPNKKTAIPNFNRISFLFTHKRHMETHNCWILGENLRVLLQISDEKITQKRKMRKIV